MCRGCCEYDQISCKCPSQGEVVGYAVPCCRNAENECDPCIIHPGCSIFENCKHCHNGTWATRDDFFIKGKYCSECRRGWSGGGCMKCGGVINAPRGEIVLESYPINAHCEWTVHVDPEFTIYLRFTMLSLEFDYNCRYDYVEIRDGDSVDSRVIGRFCGNGRPATIRSTGSSLHILFVSDGYKSFDGFHITFEENSACLSSPCLHDGTCLLDTALSFRCACLAGFTGKQCENNKLPLKNKIQLYCNECVFHIEKSKTNEIIAILGLLFKHIHSHTCTEACPVVVMCRTLPVPANGVREGNDLRFGGHVTFRCDPGFTLIGTHKATCQLDGTWSAEPPRCVPEKKQCADPGRPLNGFHLLVLGPGDTLIAVQFFCNSSYTLSGNVQRTCQPEGTWSGTQPQCIKGINFSGSCDNTLLFVHYILKLFDVFLSIYYCSNISFICNELQPQLHFHPSATTRIKTTFRLIQTAAYSYNIDIASSLLPQYKLTETSLFPEKKQCGDPGRPLHGFYLLALGSGGEPIAARFFCNNSYSLSGNAQRTCQPDGTWSGRLPQCIRACQEPKVSDLVRQKVLAPHLPFRNTPLHKLYSSSSSLAKHQKQILPSKTPPVLGELAPGFHHLYTQLQYECTSPFYQQTGSTRRTCLKTGKWSGRHATCLPGAAGFLLNGWAVHPGDSREPAIQEEGGVTVPGVIALVRRLIRSWSCSKKPGPERARAPALRAPHLHQSTQFGDVFLFCGKLPNFNLQKLADTQWPWLAAVYRRSTTGFKDESIKQDTWQLTCSGALINQRSVLVAAHCVTELGKLNVIKAADIRVLVGKHHQSDTKELKSQQQLQISAILVHPNYDPLVLDSDLAVLKLLDKARLSERVQPACLPRSHNEEGTETQGFVTGWSILSHENETVRVGAIELGDAVACERQYAQNGISVSVSDNMFCAREHPHGFSNICPSDTGGIAMVTAPSSSSPSGQQQSGVVWHLLGLVSWGYEQACSPGLYTAYTRVASFKDWIEKNMK
ncbi:PAMR1 protease, partial [Polyodon spathula]|nr:PAMR1 protease [Polyodon spathula]